MLGLETVLLCWSAKKLSQWLDRSSAIGVEGETETDGEGVLLNLHITPAFSQEVRLVMYVLTTGGTHVNGESSFKDEDGHFRCDCEIAGGKALAYLPFGAIQNTQAGLHRLRMAAVRPASSSSERLKILGTTEIQLPLPPPRQWRKIDVIRPVVDLFMAVARADRPANPQEVRYLRRVLVEEFALTPTEDGDLRVALKRSYLDSAERLAQASSRRFPGMIVSQLLERLAALVRCDGGITEEEVDAIRRIAMALGRTEAEWHVLTASLALHVSDHWSLLGLRKDATLEELKAAYRRLMKQHHPDRVAGSEPAHREVAAKKTIELTEAYKILLRRFDRQAS